ncbi:MAG: hypothetical protein Q8S14_09300, partial [Algoriphagus sp.]|uniref:hypothetical protein n=1 Tax=Algoriphagus sp. TaxID=1872435 RepID=UPI00273570F2
IPKKPTFMLMIWEKESLGFSIGLFGVSEKECKICFSVQKIQSLRIENTPLDFVKSLNPMKTLWKSIDTPEYFF